MAQPKKDSYTAKNIQVLEGLEPVRKRPGMFIGSTDTRGYHECIREIIDNSVDESFAGVATDIWVLVTKDGEAMVKDNGRGIPVDKHRSGVSALELTMTKLHAGGKFATGAYKVSGGLHGVGASVVNALSSYFLVASLRDNKAYYQEYERGKPKAKVDLAKQSQLDEWFPKEWGISINKGQIGTITRFKLDKQVFGEVGFDDAKIKSLIKDRAYLVPKLSFHFKDERDDDEAHYYFEGGIKSLVAHTNRDKTQVSDVIFINKDDGNISLDVALQYTDSYTENVKGYVNGINTTDGGTHITGFRIALTRAVTDYAKKSGFIKETSRDAGEKNGLTGEDLKEGLTAVVYIKMPSENLQFESQTKAKLNNPEIQGFAATAVKEGLDTYFEEHPGDARKILEKVLLSAKARMAARAAKEAVLRKGALDGASLPGTLADCQSNDPSKSELFIVEGDSAGGCFSANTRVALADGRNLSFRNLVREHKNGKKNYCYTIGKSGSIALAEIKNPRLTKRKTKVIKVILDNNIEIVCTPNHLFMLRDGSYKKAGNLKSSDSLMPLRRQLSKIGKRITIEGYELVYDSYEHRWLFTHLLSDRYNLKNNVYSEHRGEHKHHIDFDKTNNNPDNITRLNKKEHLKLHSEHAYKTLQRPDVLKKLDLLRKTPEYREKIKKVMTTPRMRKLLSQRAKSQWQNPDYKEYMTQKYLEFYNNNQEYREQTHKRLDKAQQVYWSSKKNRITQSEKVKRFFETHPGHKELLKQKSKEQWLNSELLKWRSQKTKEQWTNEFRKSRKDSYNKTYLLKALRALNQIYKDEGIVDVDKYQDLRKKTNDKSLMMYQTVLQRFFEGDEDKLRTAVVNYNHRIKKIVHLKKGIDVYDLEVKETHNFALASGVFVHNSAKQGRDRKFQAILPLFGKVLNTQRARIDQVIKSDKFKNLIIAIGAGIGDQFNMAKLRYHRIIIMSDADVDGSHIKCLYLTFIYRHLPGVIENGHVYIAMPPLYKIAHGNIKEYVYSEEEKETYLKTVGDKKAVVQRYKGLGEMNAQELWDTTMDPEKRILKQITIEDADAASRMFEMLMGEDVPPRKRFIQTHAKLATLDI